MKEIPILFSTPMVQAILDGRKSMTRRVCHLNTDNFDWDKNDKNYGPFLQDKYGDSINVKEFCPYQPGDVLWVRETWCNEWQDPDGWTGNYLYRADGVEVCNVDDHSRSPWRPSIFMPKIACRIWLENEGVRVERLQDITEEDAIREGIYRGANGRYADYPSGETVPGWINPIDSFRTLWDSINAAPKPIYRNKQIVAYESYPWKDIQEVREYRGKPWIVTGNPWVWAVAFRRVVE